DRGLDFSLETKWVFYKAHEVGRFSMSPDGGLLQLHTGRMLRITDEGVHFGNAPLLEATIAERRRLPLGPPKQFASDEEANIPSARAVLDLALSYVKARVRRGT